MSWHDDAHLFAGAGRDRSNACSDDQEAQVVRVFASAPGTRQLEITGRRAVLAHRIGGTPDAAAWRQRAWLRLRGRFSPGET